MPQLRCMLIQLHSRDILRTKLWLQYRYPVTFRIASNKAKNRHSPGRTETEGIAKLSRPFDIPRSHWPPTFQARDKTRRKSAELPSNDATATPPRWGAFGWNLKKSVTKSSQLMENTSKVMVTDICERFGQKTQINMVAYRSNIRQKDRHFDFELTNFTCLFLNSDTFFAALE